MSLASTQAATRSERRAGPEKGDVEADPATKRGRLAIVWGSERRGHPDDSTGVVAAARVHREIDATREALWR